MTSVGIPLPPIKVARPQKMAPFVPAEVPVEAPIEEPQLVPLKREQ